jgi:hypothetical protein
MLELFVFLMLIALFAVGYGARSYVGVLVPGIVLVFAVVAYIGQTPTDDEVRVLPAIFVVASVIGVLVYLAGVALGRRRSNRA